MRFLFGPRLSAAVTESARHCSYACLISGFVKSDFLQRLQIDKDCELELFTRWRLSDLVSGGSDLSAYKEVSSLGGKFHINPRLHAKVFIFDDKVFCGSANLTASGLPTNDLAGNIEAGVELSMSDDVENLVASLRRGSLILNGRLFDQISNEVMQSAEAFNLYSIESHSKMPNAFESAMFGKRQQTLTGYDLPWTESPGELLLGSNELASVAHDIELFYLGKNPSRASIFSAFLHSSCYSWLIRNTQEPINFGGLTKKLHADLRGDPLPYRSHIKSLLENLLSWAIECDPKNFRQTRYRRTASYQSLRKS